MFLVTPRTGLADEIPTYPSVKMFGYTQFTGTFASAATPHQFGFDRVRFGAKGKIEEGIDYRMLVEMLKTDQPTKANTTNEALLDAQLAYTFAPAAKVTVGQGKTPFGMEFNTSAAKLDVIGFGMSGNVVFDRGLGVMVSGRKIAGGLGYDLGIYNAGGRGDGTSYSAGTLGNDDLVVGRLLFDLEKTLHVEGGVGQATVTGGGTYSASYAAVKTAFDPIEIKVEWDRGVQGGRTTTVMYAQVLGKVAEQVEAVAKWEQTKRSGTGSDLTATNTTLACNFALDPSHADRVRIQAAYVWVGGDAASIGSVVGFKKGVKDDLFKVLVQAGF
ncbi:MAG: hypothetical protein AUJ55_13165 [Proteobacteria bacterium CG1_02_64_396]|nr:MAG: hypothetical protein AUJ55_13165 [Proteobacteria bacterium CG1_02_64_396]